MSPSGIHSRKPAAVSVSSFFWRLLLFVAVCTALADGAWAQSEDILPLDQVQPGMQGYAYTIFAGDQVEKFDLEVIGVMPNFLGPKQSIILVQLKGPKVEHTGVVAGMSGSPVYIEGKLAGALSLKLGIFTKEPIAGVTPIADVLAAEESPAQLRYQRLIRRKDRFRTDWRVNFRSEQGCRAAQNYIRSKRHWFFPDFRRRQFRNFQANWTEWDL